MTKRYFFAHFFVRAAKALALLVFLVGIAFCLLRYYQAKTAAGAAAYQPSRDLQQSLAGLKDAFSATEDIVDSFDAANQSSTPKVQPPDFPVAIDSSNDFDRIAAELARIEKERQHWKESIVSRFETLVKSIEAKLHAYAAALQSLPSPTPGTTQNLVSNVTPPAPTPTFRNESLFSFKVGLSEVNARVANLAERKEFLKLLGTKAENADNRAILGEAADQLERLAKLLPDKIEASTGAQPDSGSTASNEPRVELGTKLLPSERVARQLEQLRAGVRQMMLTSWTLDDRLEEVSRFNSVERNRYRAATLEQKRVWLSTASQIVVGLLATGLAGFLVLVFGDLVRTQLDTAASSVTVADAINAFRGSVAVTPLDETTLQTEMARPVIDEAPIEGGS